MCKEVLFVDTIINYETCAKMLASVKQLLVENGYCLENAIFNDPAPILVTVQQKLLRYSWER